MRTIAVWTFLSIGALSPLAAQVNFGPTNCGTQELAADICLFTPSGGTGPYTFSYTVDNAGAPATAKPKIPNFRVLNSPNLPTWANPQQTGAIGGLPTTTGTFTTTIRCTDNGTGAFIDQDVTFTVVPLDIQGGPPPDYGIGDTVSYQFLGVGGTAPYHFALDQSGGSLPDGLSLDQNTGILSGTIQDTANNNSNAMTAANGNGFGFNITISDSSGDAGLTRYFGMSFSAFRVLVGGVPVNQGNNRYLPNGNVGQVYSQQFSVVGGTSAQGPYTFSLGPGSSLPAGLTLSPSGILSGTATQSVFGFHFTIHVRDSAVPAHTSDLRFGISMLPATPSPLTISTSNLYDAGLGQDISLGFYSYGGLPPYSYALSDRGNLPADAEMVSGWTNGPNWDPDSGQLRARIHALGQYHFTVQVTDAGNNTATRSYTWNVQPLTLFSPYPSNAIVGTPYQFPMIALGGSGLYNVTPLNIPAGLSVDAQGLLSGTPLENGNYLPLNITLTDAADISKTYTSNGNITIYAPTAVSLACTGGKFTATQGSQYTLSLACGQSTNIFTSVAVTNGSLPSGLLLLTGADFSNNGNASIAAQLAGIPTAAGDYSFVYTVVDSAGNQGSREIQLHVNSNTLNIVNPVLASGVVTEPYNQPVSVVGGTPPYTFSATDLPNGLAINSSTGIISGTPSTSSATAITVFVQDTSGNATSRSYFLNIFPVDIANPLPATPNVLPLAFANEPYSVALQGLPAGAYQWTASGLPAGLSLDPNTGVLSGTPTNVSVFNLIYITAANSSNQVISKYFMLYITSRQNLPVITSLPGPRMNDVLVGSPAFLIPGGSGGTPPYTVTVSSGALPPGLQIEDVGAYFGTIKGIPVIVGIPTTVGSYAFTLHYVDSAGLAEDRPTSINVTPLALASSSTHIGLVNQPYAAQLHGIGGTGAYTFAVSNLPGNAMPPGLTLNPDGSITGTPTSTGNFSTTIDVTNGALSGRLSFSIQINATNDNRQVSLSTFNGTGLADVPLGRTDAMSFQPLSGVAPYTWNLVSGSLPPGFALLAGPTLPQDLANQSVALAAGSGNAAGTYPFRVRVDDSSGTFGIRDATLTISPLHPLPPSTYAYQFYLPPGQVGTAYSFQWNIAGGKAPYTFTQLPGTFLPAGVSLSAGGLMTGAPGSAGNFQLNLLVKDANGVTANISRTWTVYPGKIGLFSAYTILQGAGEVASASIGIPYTISLNDLLAPNFGTAPFTWSLFSGSLPANLVITPGGGVVSDAITGTPAAPAATSKFTLLATDANGLQSLIPLTLIVSNMGVTPVQGPLPTGVVGTPYSQQLTASGGTPPYTFAASWFSDLAAGLNVSPSGLISGTPGVYGQFVVWVDITDSTGALFRARYPLTVSPTGTVIPSLTVVPKSINVPYVTGDPDPAPIPLSVAANPSTSTLNYTVVASGGSWLSVSTGSGTTPSSPAITINPTGLLPNTYNGAVTITSAVASNSPFVVPVVLTVTAPVACGYSVVPPSGSLQSAATSSSFAVQTTDPSCQWTASTATPWISLATTSGTGNANVNFSVSANAGTTRNGAITVQGVNYNVTQFGASSCDLTLVPSTINIGAAGGTGQIAVNVASPSCQWNLPVVPPAGVTLAVADTNTGSGHLNVTVAANTAASTVTDLITISTSTSAQNLTLNEASASCSFIFPGGTSVPSTGGPVSFTVTTQPACAWAADTGPSWITLASGGAGPGTGPVALNIAANTTTAPRTASVIIAGTPYQITQAGVPCSFSLAVNNPVIPSGGGNGAAGVTATGGPGCGWTASTDAAWIALSATTGVDSTPPSVSFRASANTGAAARSANVTIAGQNILVTQSGTVCSFTLRSLSAGVPATGGANGVGVLTAAGCNWNAATGLPGWLHTTSAASITGPGDYTFTADPNTTGSTRSAVLSLAGANFSVTQPAEACAVSLVTSTANSVQFGGPGQFSYNAACPVTIQSYASWITVTNTATPGLVEYNVTANPTGARSGMIWVNDQAFTVTQDASTCIYDMTPGGFLATFAQGGGNGSILMNFAPAACGPPPVLVNAPPGMITLGPVTNTSTTYTQNYNVSLYLSFINYVRTAQLSVSGQIYTVKQTSW